MPRDLFPVREQHQAAEAISHSTAEDLHWRQGQTPYLVQPENYLWQLPIELNVCRMDESLMEATTRHRANSCITIFDAHPPDLVWGEGDLC